MKRKPNPLITNNFIDSCAFDSKYEPEDRASLEIFRLREEDSLEVQIAHSTQKEIDHPNTPAWVKREAQNLLFTIPVDLAPEEIDRLPRIDTILAGNGKVENTRPDARHVFEAQKYGKYFVTTDSRILKRAEELFRLCQVTILKPSDFLSLVKHHLSGQQNDRPESC
mgnify:CR=1 FL=1